MDNGRLIRVSKHQGDPKPVAYIVAVAESAQAIELIRSEVGHLCDEIEDLGRVSDALLIAMKIKPGSFVRA
jgi:hypothetical protein